MWLLRVVPLLLLSLSALQAQSVLEGRVTDPQGAPLHRARLLLQSRDGRAIYSVRSAEDGRFRFPAAAPGDYVLEATAPEFAAAVRRLRLPGDAGQPLALALALASVNEQVVVTATGGPQLPQETAHAASSLDATELAVRQENLLSDSLAAVPGLRVERTAGPGSFTRLIFRGLRTTDTSVLLDGLPVRDAIGFRGDLVSFFGELNPNDVSAIEVVRGPGSVLYGSAASGGVINFVPRESAEGPRLAFGYEGGSLAQAIGRFSIAGAARERFGYTASVIRTDVNSGEDGNDVWRNTNVSAHARYRLRPGMSLTGNLYLSDTPRLNLNLSPFPIGPAGNELGYENGRGPVVGFVSNLDDPDDYRVARILPVSTRFDHTVNGAYGYSVAYQAVFSRRNFPSGPLQDPLATRLGVFPSVAEIARFDGDDHLLDTHHTLALGRHSLWTFGYQYEHQSATQEYVSGDFHDGPSTDRQSSHAAFFHQQLSLLDRRLQIGFGGRYQSFRVENPGSIPSLSGLRTPSAKTGDISVAYYLPRTGTKLRAHGGNAFREPSLSERFQIATLSGQRVRIGNPLIEPERSVSVDAGLDQFLWHDRLQIGATYFYTRLQSLIESGTLFQQRNVRGGLSRGAEFELRSQPTRYLSLRWAYTYTNSDFLPAFFVLRADGTNALGGVARPLEGVPAHTYSFSATTQRGRWDGFLSLAAIGGYEAPLFSPVQFEQVLFHFDGYARVSVGMGYTQPLSERWRMRWFARVENALNKLYYEEGFRSPRAVGMAGVRFLF